jgi:hypothetical protein
MHTRKAKRHRGKGQAVLWISGFCSLAGYALGVGARYWRV